VLVDAWMLSPDHRANVLHPMFRDLGIGTAFAAPDPAFYPDHPSLVVTTDFGQRVMARAGAKRCRGRRARARRGAATTRGRFCARRRRA
jgi:hypothetical protein